MTYQVGRLLIGSALVGLALMNGCGKQRSTATVSAKSEQPTSDSLEGRIDQHGDRIIASPSKAEARQWMKQPSHVFLKANPQEVSRFVEEFYSAGATQVFIADIEEHEGKLFGEALLVVLPQDAPARAKLFEIGARAAATFQNDPVTDKGQKYLYYSLG
jgi:hypothetical protein